MAVQAAYVDNYRRCMIELSMKNLLGNDKTEENKTLCDLLRDSMYLGISNMFMNINTNPGALYYNSPFKIQYDFVTDVKRKYVNLIRHKGDSLGIDDIKYLDTLIFNKITDACNPVMEQLTNIAAIVGFDRLDYFLMSNNVLTLEYSIQNLKSKCKEIIALGNDVLGYDEIDLSVVYNSIDEYIDIYHDFVSTFKEVVDCVIPSPNTEADNE